MHRDTVSFFFGAVLRRFAEREIGLVVLNFHDCHDDGTNESELWKGVRPSFGDLSKSNIAA